MSVIGRAEVEVGPKTDSFASELKSKIGDALKNPAVVAGAAVAAVGATVTAFAKSSVDRFKEVGSEVTQLTRLTGGSAESMSRLRFAANATGVSTDSLGSGLKKLSLDISNNTNKLKDAGIAFTDAKGKALPLDATLANVAQKFATMPNGIAKNTLAVELFGKSGTDLIPILNKGKAGLSELSAESDKYGLTLTGKNLDSIRENAKAHRELKEALEGVKVQVGAALMPALAEFATFVSTKALPSITGITELVRDKFGPAVSEATKAAKEGFSAFTEAFKTADGDITSSGLNGYLEGFGNTVRIAFDDAKIAWGAFTDGWKDNKAVGSEVGNLAIAFAATGVAVRDALAFLKDLGKFLLDHETAVKNVTLAVLGFKAAYETVQFGNKTINFVANGLDAAKNAVNDIVSGFAKIGDKVISIAVKSTAEQAAGGAASGAGNAVGQQAGNVVSGAAGGAIGNFLDLKSLGPKIKVFAKGFAVALAGALVGAIEGIGTALAAAFAVLISPEVLIGFAVVSVATIVTHFRKGIIHFFSDTLPQAIKTAIDGAGDFLSFLAEKGKDLLTGLLNGAAIGLKAVGLFFINLPNYIGYAIGYVGGTLIVAGRDLLIGLFVGVKFVYEEVSAFFVALPGALAGFVGDVTNTLYQLGRDLLTGLWRGIQEIYADVAGFFRRLASETTGFIGDVAGTLYQKGADLLTGLKNGILVIWNDPVAFFKALPGNIVGFVGDVGRTLYTKGQDLISGLKHGIENLYDSAISKFRDLRSNVIGAVSGPASWLIEAGKDVIKGLLNGIGQLYESVVAKMRSIGGSIIHGFRDAVRSSSPSQAFHDQGSYLMQGLANGIGANAHLVMKAIANVADAVLDPLGNTSLALPNGKVIGGAQSNGRSLQIGAIHINNSKTLQENLDEIDRLAIPL